jgi:uncharacterized repeat protein (TIGR01451 family)
MKTRRILFSLALALGLTLAVLVGLGGSLPRARAATYTVTNTNPSGPGSLRQAILDANGNAGHDTIDFSVTGAIVLADALPAISDDLTITGPGAAQLDVSGANAYQVFHINSGAAVTITGLTVRDGSAVSGGGIWSAGALHLGAAHIFSNSASISGGGVYVLGGSATLSGTPVVSNSASISGGGVYVSNGSATLDGTQVVSNSAGAGGGVYVYQASATLNVSGGEVGSNSASINGGGVYVLGGSATLSGTPVVSNSASKGGGVYVYWGSATLSESPVIRNSAVYSGGGVFVNDGSGTLNVSGGEVGSNSADYGGGVYVNQGSATLSGGQILSNSAGVNGGGVYVGQVTAAFTQTGASLIAHNTANGAGLWDGGGGVYVDEGSATLNGTQVVSNLANYGGGVHVEQGSATLNVSGGRIDSNLALDGGGVYVRYGSATLSGTQVISNSASGNGGGVYVYRGSATLNGTQVVRNSASYNGGGLYLSSSTGAITATDGCIVYNSDTAVDNDSTGTLNARDNWWGMPDGPSGVGPGSGDSVSAYVDYANFKTSPPAGCPAYRPDLTIAKSVTPTTDAAYHVAVTYTVRLNNSGWLSDTNVLFTDTLPSEVDFGAFVGADHGASVDDDELTWAGTVTAGEALTWTFTALHTGSYGDVVTNAAEFSGALQAGDDDVVFTVVEPHTIFLPLVLRNN